MREILFRAKRIDNGDWIYGDLIQKIDCVKIRESEADINRIAKSYVVIPETVGQFTGLIDKNGKKIWEGDILRSVYGELTDDDVFIDTVVFHEGCFCGEINNEGITMYGSFKDITECEVIGNIHDKEE